MIQLILLIGLALFAVYALGNLLQSAKARPKLRRELIWLAVLLVFALAASGRLGLLLPLLGALLAALLRFLPVLLPMLLQLLPLWLRKQQQTAYTRTSGGTDSSVAEAKFLRMRLDHASGEIGGEILQGRYAGRQLSELNPQQLAGLYQDYAANDQESAALLRAYLDRVYGPEWQEIQDDPGPRGRPTGGKMSLEEARQVLGLGPDARREDIIAAHRRLMQRLHPDRGGSDYLAAKINQAKDVLLG